MPKWERKKVNWTLSGPLGLSSKEAEKIGFRLTPQFTPGPQLCQADLRSDSGSVRLGRVASVKSETRKTEPPFELGGEGVWKKYDLQKF